MTSKQTDAEAGLAVEQSAGVVTVTLARPEKLNAFDGAMLARLREVLEGMRGNDEQRVLIITGAGRAFSAGADYGWYRPETWARDLRTIARVEIHNIFDELEWMEKPVIAAINGVCVGGGLELALSCDLRVAGESAKFGLPEVNFGVIPGAGGCSRLTRSVSLCRAKYLIFTGELISATEAERIGLINRVVPDDRVLDEAKELAAKLREKAPLALGAAKHVIGNALNVDLHTGRVLERLGAQALAYTEDAREGNAAFRQRRKPNYRYR